jgi:hypothetical protein
VNLCRACELDFGSLRSSDLHRTGPHADGRRCLSERELGPRGLTRKVYGRWTLAAEGERARQRFGVAGVDQDASPSTSEASEPSPARVPFRARLPYPDSEAQSS